MTEKKPASDANEEDRFSFKRARERSSYRRSCVFTVAEQVRRDINKALSAPYLTDYTIF